MADKEITSLTAATTPLAGTELVHIDQGGNSRKATLSDVAAIATGAMLKAEYDPDANGIIAVAQGGTNAATASGARTNLGLGTMAVQGAGAVAITGGTVVGITDLTVADGGTGASDASTARTNLGLAIGTDVQAYSANLAGFAATTVANVQNRDNHHGTQLASTISDFSTAADLRVSAAIGSTVQAYSALLDSVSALSLTAGDIIYATGSDAVASLPVGAAGQVLAVNGSGEPAWDTSLVVGGLIAANNLSDVDDAGTALDNLGLGAPGTAGLAILADATEGDVRNYLGVGPASATRAAMQLLDTSKDTESLLTEARREGPFLFTGSTLASIVAGSDIASSAVNAGTDTITSNAHGQVTGNACIATTAVNGLALNTFYYFIRVDANNYKLAASFADAHAGTAIDLTGTSAVTVRRHYDPQQIVYVLPTTDYTGASGGWVRIHNGVLHTNWSGANIAFADASEHLTAMWDLVNKLNIPLNIMVDRYYALGRKLPKFTVPVIIDGGSASRNGFDKQYVESVGTAGIIHAEQCGIEIRNMYISASSGSGGTAITAITTGTSAQTGFFRISNCSVSCGDFVGYSLYINGQSATGSAKGYRSPAVENCTFFGAQFAVMWLGGVHHMCVNNTLLTIAGGSATIALQTFGDATVGTPNFSFTGGGIDGAVYLEFLTSSNIQASYIAGAITVNGTCANVKINAGYVGGTVSFASGATDCVVAARVDDNVTYTSGAIRCSVTGSISGTISNPTPANLCGFPRVAVNSGGTSTARWVRFSDGWLEQHGQQATTAGAVGPFNFPTAFGATPEAYGANVVGTPGADRIFVAQAYGASATQLSLRNMTIITTPTVAVDSQNVKWWAKGY